MFDWILQSLIWYQILECVGLKKSIELRRNEYYQACFVLQEDTWHGDKHHWPSSIPTTVQSSADILPGPDEQQTNKQKN